MSGRTVTYLRVSSRARHRASQRTAIERSATRGDWATYARRPLEPGARAFPSGHLPRRRANTLPVLRARACEMGPRSTQKNAPLAQVRPIEVPRYRSSGVRPVCLAIFFSMLRPISSPS